MRRLINLGLIGLAFYGGLKFERLMNAGRCTNAGGEVTLRHVCVGAEL